MISIAIDKLDFGKTALPLTMDISSPRILKLKGALFALLGNLAGGLLLADMFTWRNLLLFCLSVWAFSRCYYFYFYVLHHYVDPSFRYAGIMDLLKYLVRRR